MKIGSINREVRNIGGKITVNQVQGKRLLVRVYYNDFVLLEEGYHLLLSVKVVLT